MHLGLRVLKYLAVSLVGLLLFALIVVLGAWGLANTDQGREWLSARMADALSTPEGRAEVVGLEGPFPQRVALERVVLRDGEGAWLTVESAEVAWSPRALLAGRIDIDVVAARRVAVHRAPPPDATERPEDARVTLPRLPLPVQLDRLMVERLEIDEPVVGEAAVFRVDGRAAAPTGGELRSELQVTRLDGPETHLQATARFLPEDDRLSLDARLNEPEGGFIARALNLAPDVSIRAELSGEGPLNQWRGHAHAALGPDVTVDLDLALVDAEALEASGRAEVRAFLPPDIAELVGGPVDLDLRVRRGDGNVVHLDRAEAASPTATVGLAGDYDGGEGAIDIAGTLDLRDPGPVNALAAPAAMAEVNATFAAEGPVLAPSLRLEGSAGRLSLPEGALEGVGLRADFVPRSGLAQGDFTLEAESERVVLSDPALADLSGAPLSLSLSSAVDLTARRLDEVALRVANPFAEARVDGGLALDEFSGDAAFEVAFPELGRLSALANQEMSGRGRLEGNVAMPDGEGGARATVLGDFRDLRWGDPRLAGILGDRVALEAEGVQGADGRLSLRGLSVEGGAVSLGGEAELPADFSTVDGRFTLRVPDLRPVGAAMETELSGGGQADIRVAGAMADPEIDARLHLDNVRAAGTALGRFEVEARVRELAQAPAGSIAARVGESPVGAVEAATDFVLRDSILRVEGFRASTADGLEISDGGLVYPLDGGAMEGGATLSAPDLATVAGRFDLPGLAGRGRATLALRPGEVGQAASVEGAVEGVRLDEEVRVASVAVRADLDDLLGTPRGALSVRVREADIGPTRVEGATFAAEGTLEEAALSLQAEGEVFGPLSVDADAVVRRDGAATMVRVDRFEAGVQSHSFALVQPTRLDVTPEGYSLQDFALAAGDGVLHANVVQEGGAIDASVDLDALPLSLTRLVLAEPTLSGRIEGQLRLAGPLAAPEGTAQLAVHEVAVAEADLPELDLWFTGHLDAGELGVTGQLRGLSPTPVQMVLRLPAGLSLDPPAFDLVRTEPISGELTWSGNVAPLMPLFPTSGHELRGRGEVALNIAGTLDEPRIEGHAELRDGRYENLVVGTLLTDLNARLEGDGARLELTRLEAGDGGRGRVSGEGRISFATGEDTPVHVMLNADRATLVRRDDLTARSDARITLSGRPEDLLLEGLITLDRGEARMPERLPPQVVDLDVIEVGGGRAVREELEGAEDEARRARDDAGGQAVAGGQIRLDVAIDIPGRFFMRGAGMDSEWSGNLLVQGTSAAPLVLGRMQIVRGQFDFFGRSFAISEGSVAFDGGAEIDPIIQAEARTTTRDIEATISIDGPVSAPEISFSSVPELPQDEIVSRLLFGTSVTNLSALEAAQLGAAVAQLSTGGLRGDGFMGRIRSALGVDVLRFGEEDGDATITAGRYVSDDLFIGLERGVEADTGSVRLEYELTDNISVESDVGATGRSQVSIQFKWDY